MTNADGLKLLTVAIVLMGSLFTLKADKISFTYLHYLACTIVVMSFCAFLFLRMIS